ncbi:DUF2690 domain-containing protein [Micromonospora costi]|uniref:DUF2690 domain-containing protein n=1 Tax=Micromonospora costi TaxID=1530042 RepID=A0A3B0A122_9ACTN|nr:DUF2690 domain-containing protein [Micromonospora costi]RKN53047.1 DUF2690 domain-containing protein [Micromonospora costi]
MKSRILRVLAAFMLVTGLAVTAPQPAQAACGYACDGKDAAAYGCGSTITALEKPIIATTYVTGKIELRYSQTCRTVWARIQIWKADYEKGAISWAKAQVIRTSDNKVMGCTNLAWSNVTGSYTCYTPMLNDAGLTSFANAQVYYYNAHLYAETGLY